MPVGDGVVVQSFSRASFLFYRQFFLVRSRFSSRSCGSPQLAINATSFMGPPPQFSVHGGRHTGHRHVHPPRFGWDTHYSRLKRPRAVHAEHWLDDTGIAHLSSLGAIHIFQSEVSFRPRASHHLWHPSGGLQTVSELQVVVGCIHPSASANNK
jgi:hypothetical protein